MPVGPRIHPDGQDKFSGRENESSWLTTDAANPCQSTSARRKRKKRGIFCDFFGLLLFVSTWSVISEFLSVLLHGFIDYILKI